MSKPVAPVRAQAASGELRQASSRVRESGQPTQLNRALVQLLEATARYWDLWLPESPTAIDTATLLIARAITQAPATAAGKQPTTPDKKGTA
jgi:hypothetical protein